MNTCCVKLSKTCHPSSLFIVLLCIFTFEASAFPSPNNLVSHIGGQRLSTILYNQKHAKKQPPFSIDSRRNILKKASAILPLQFLLSSSLLPQNANGATGAAESSTELPNGLLESRVLEYVLSPPPYGMECTDIVYPRYVQCQQFNTMIRIFDKNI